MAEQRLLAVSPNLPCAMDRQEWRLEDYHIVKTLYNGYAAQVYTATCRYSGMEVVLKIYQDVDKAPDVAQHEMYREVAIQSGLQHPNVVHLYGAFEEGDTLILVQEYVPNGDLLALMQSHGGRVDEATVVKAVLRPLLGALMYLHRWGIVHRDIKPENVLFALDSSIKLADFGLAINMVEERPISRVGTLDYMAPEVLRCPIKQSMAMTPAPGMPARYGFATDVWAVGIVTFELLTGLPPFASECRYQAESRICSALPPIFPLSISPMARDFILRALAPIPGDRPTIRQMMEHPWIVNPDACLATSRSHTHTYSYAQPHLQPQRSYTPTVAPAIPQHTLGGGYSSDPQHSVASRAAAAAAAAAPATPRPSAAVSAPPSAASTAAASPTVSPKGDQKDQLSQFSAVAGPVTASPQGSPHHRCHAQDSQHLQHQRALQHPQRSQSSHEGLSIDQQLRVLQQQQLLDLSRLPLDQIQGMIQKLQEAMQLAVVQQQQTQLQPQPQVLPQPADSETSAVNPGKSAVIPGPAVIAHSRCSGGVVPLAASSNTPRSVAAGEDVHMADVALEAGEEMMLATGAYVVIGRMQTAATSAIAVAAPSTAYSSTNSPYRKQQQQAYLDLHQHQHRQQHGVAATAAVGATGKVASTVIGESVSHTSTARDYASLCASRRTTADATPRGITAAIASNSPTQLSCMHYHVPTEPALPRIVEGGSTTLQAAGGLAIAPSNNAAAAGVSTTPQHTCSGGDGGSGRCSHGGTLHEGDGLVYVSIGSSRKATAVEQCEGNLTRLGLDGGDQVMAPGWMQQTGAL